MNKKERKKRERKTIFTRKMISRKTILLILIIIIGIVILLFQFFSRNPKKDFTLEEKNGKIVVHGLEKEEIDKIDWENGMKSTLYWHKEIPYQICFQEEKNIFWKIWKKPTNYHAPSKLSGNELKGKDLEFEGFPEIKNKKIVKNHFTNWKVDKVFSSEERNKFWKHI